MRTLEKLYEFHTENLRSVAEGLDNVFAAARWAIATRRESAGPTYVRLYAFLMGAWAECRLLKLLYERKAFTDVERAGVLAEKALERWLRVVEIAFRRHYGIPTAKLAPPALPATAAARHQLLNDVLTVDLQAVIRLRNKLAHGQWVYPLNNNLDDVAQEQMDALRTETILSLKQKAALVESLCAAVHDLVISKATFERDFDDHFRQIEQTRINIARKDYTKWVEQVRRKHERGVQDMRNRIRARNQLGDAPASGLEPIFCNELIQACC